MKIGGRLILALFVASTLIGLALLERRIKALEDTTIRVPTNPPTYITWTNIAGTTFATSGVTKFVDKALLLTNGMIFPVKQPYTSVTNRGGLSNYWESVGRYEHFDTGFRLGYARAAAGGSRTEGNMLIDAFRRNRPDIVSNWFELHK
jgi:hypothetical protein